MLVIWKECPFCVFCLFALFFVVFFFLFLFLFLFFCFFKYIKIQERKLSRFFFFFFLMRSSDRIDSRNESHLHGRNFFSKVNIWISREAKGSGKLYSPIRKIFLFEVLLVFLFFIFSFFPFFFFFFLFSFLADCFL